MRIIVDTNIWLDFLAGKPETIKLKSLVSQLKVLRHIWVESELRVGNIPNQDLFLSYYHQIPETIFVDYEVLFQFIQEEKLAGEFKIVFQFFPRCILTNLYLCKGDRN